MLSGGEQQMLTMCRTLMGDPDLILIDEPTEGLAPKLVEQVGELLAEIARRGVAILLVEQKLAIALKIRAGFMSWATAGSCFKARPADLARQFRRAQGMAGGLSKRRFPNKLCDSLRGPL